MSDGEVARKTSRSLPVIGKKRVALGRTALNARGVPKFWTPEEDKAVRTLPREEATRVTCRSLRAVDHRRRFLGLTGGRGK